ncbi:hypothetical protein BSKO_06430 [Bryopsis sp. KO-2023]|nr:hypothetical protein BSKO_06430 [Bryopsis sp. KO-2023]
MGVLSYAAPLKWAWLTVMEFTKADTTNLVTREIEPKATGDRRNRSDTTLARKGSSSSLTWEDVAKHNSVNDCWVVIRGKVYDVTEFGRVHPGGRVIYLQGGRDATEVFSTFHSKSTWSMLEGLHVGDLVDDQDGSEIIRDFRRLRMEFTKQGLFKSSKAYYAYKLLGNLAILATAITVLLASSGAWLGLVASAFLLGLFWQQCGWLAHDFLHHQVFSNRWWNNAFGYLVGNVFQGFSVDWWKSKHNTHHAVPNEFHEDIGAMDPDIDTLPLLAWSTDMVDSITDATSRAMIRVQHYIFFPILMLARISWAQQSISHACRITSTMPKKGWVEVALLAVHYAWYVGLAFLALPPLKAVLYLLLSQSLCGFMLGIAFVQSHNGMEVYCDVKDFVTAQVVSTRDIAHNAWVHWFMGGLNYQIEHHLFPSMPRHNLMKIQEPIKALCKKHDLPFEECDMVTGTKRVIGRLIEVSKYA